MSGLPILTIYFYFWLTAVTFRQVCFGKTNENIQMSSDCSISAELILAIFCRPVDAS